jgi:hypothetical protein
MLTWLETKLELMVIITDLLQLSEWLTVYGLLMVKLLIIIY